MSPRANNSKGEAVVNDSPADCQSRRADRSIFSAEKMQDRAVQVQPPQPTSSTEKDIGAENPETTTVSGFFYADF